MKASHTWRNQVGTDLEVSSLLTGFHRTGRCYAQYWRGKGINLTYMWTLRATVITGLTRHTHWYNNSNIVELVHLHYGLADFLLPIYRTALITKSRSPGSSVKRFKCFVFSVKTVKLPWIDLSDNGHENFNFYYVLWKLNDHYYGLTLKCPSWALVLKAAHPAHCTSMKVLVS